MCAAPWPSSAALGGSLDAFRRACGVEVETSAYHPQLYPTSHVFQHEDVTFVVTPLPADNVAKLGVFFDAVPTDGIATLLECYSGEPGWEPLPTTDPAVVEHFPLFQSDEARNSFHQAKNAVALVQRDVGFGKCLLWIQARAWPELLAAYRAQPRPACSDAR